MINGNCFSSVSGIQVYRSLYRVSLIHPPCKADRARLSPTVFEYMDALSKEDAYTTDDVFALPKRERTELIDDSDRMKE